MARPLKDGIDYFPLDVNFLKDIKTRKLLKACGPQSIAVLIGLLCNIYQDEGYYMTWDDDAGFLIADDVGVKESLVHEVVKKAISVDFFDKDLFENYKILTSIGIQKRYLEATYRRKDNSIKSSYNLVNEYNNGVNVDNNSVNDDKSTQTKLKETKLKESKVKETLKNTNSVCFSAATLEKILDRFKLVKPEINQADINTAKQVLSEFSEKEVLLAIDSAGTMQSLRGEKVDGFGAVRSLLYQMRKKKDGVIE